MSKFGDKVIEIVRAVPKGKVVSYGQVALYAGLPRSAREVGMVLHNTQEKVSLPWWRVINRNGLITIKGAKSATPLIQKKLLEEEGIEVSETYVVSMSEYRFVADEKMLKQFLLPEEYIKRVLEKYTP